MKENGLLVFEVDLPQSLKPKVKAEFAAFEKAAAAFREWRIARGTLEHDLVGAEAGRGDDPGTYRRVSEKIAAHDLAGEELRSDVEETGDALALALVKLQGSAFAAKFDNIIEDKKAAAIAALETVREAVAALREVHWAKAWLENVDVQEHPDGYLVWERPGGGGPRLEGRDSAGFVFTLDESIDHVEQALNPPAPSEPFTMPGTFRKDV
jgi:hypothetical protein